MHFPDFACRAGYILWGAHQPFKYQMASFATEPPAHIGDIVRRRRQ